MTVAALRALLDVARPGVTRHPAPLIPHTAHRRQDPHAQPARRPPLMATHLVLPGGIASAVALVDALLVAADARQQSDPAQASGWRGLAHQLGDALDSLPTPTGERT